MIKTKIDIFNESVLFKYEVYNSLFQKLPFEDVHRTGMLLPLLHGECTKGYNNNQAPVQIIEDFFDTYVTDYSDKEKSDLLFNFIRYIERQVVLFDAIEDAAFTKINDTSGVGTIKNLKNNIFSSSYKLDGLKELLNKCSVRVVLTAHPTQFYPDNVLGIINDLSEAIRKNNITKIKTLLSQLGKTPFFNESKPTPYKEAISLIWYMDNVFYNAIADIYQYVKVHLLSIDENMNMPIFQLGFWPGGDRDGNPFVTSDITRKVGQNLRSTIIRCYYRDTKKLARRLTFRKVSNIISDLQAKLYQNIFLIEENSTIDLHYIQKQLYKVRNIIINKHQSLYLDKVDDLINKTYLFGLYFATLDIRQDSRIHTTAFIDVINAYSYLFPKEYKEFTDKQKIEYLSTIDKGNIDSNKFNEEISRQTVASIYTMKKIQKYNGEKGANRYIISNTQSMLNIIEIFTLIRLCDWENPTVDIIPLFETVNDLDNAPMIMENLYKNHRYKEHIKQREQKQTIMLGFSDGTKDGGYLMANWAIYKAKEALTTISRKYNIKVSFFDGRGGPPARGGGKTHQFFASLGSNIESEHVELTVQGQTISSNFGIHDSCKYNLEQLLSASLTNQLNKNNNILENDDREILDELAEISYNKYLDFKQHPKFIPYLEKMSAIKFYGKTNIGSRPSKRGKSEDLIFSDLRAIPFVGSWSQLKQNVPGFFGVGTSINSFKERGEFKKVKKLYDNSLFFRTLLENTMMSLTKSFFKLTTYMKDDSEFGEFWNIIHNEYVLTKNILLNLSGYDELMENMPSGKRSIEIRENIVLPLLTIQQYALKKYRDSNNNSSIDKDIYEKMITRSLFGNINASRNSA